MEVLPMKMALAMLAVFATLVTLIATVLVLAAFALGKALSLVLPFSVFEASLLSMLALWLALWALWQIVTSGQNDDIRHAWADEQDDDDEVEEESFDEQRDEGKGVAWAVPLRPVISPPQIGRDSLCPCGSGRKYKRCCGKEDRPARKATRQ
jgi:type VI protein secretion system component VasK